MNGSERKVLFKMLDDLIIHFKNTGNLSLIARIYGVYTIRSSAFEAVDVLVMQNTVMKKD